MMNTRKVVPSKRQGDRKLSPTASLSDIHTPFDDIIPEVDDPSAQFYLDAMRIYLGLSSGTLSFDDAIDATEMLKKNPEFSRSPSNPTQLPINDYYTSRILENLKTLSKFNLVTKDSIRSAYTFAFLYPDSPISPNDLETLYHLTNDPLSSIANLARRLDVTPRTVSRALDRLNERHDIRYRALLDESIWNLNRVLVFFIPKKELDWISIEDQLITFPFIKTILKTSMSDLGYMSVIVPGEASNVKSFLKSLNNISSDLFDYKSIHLDNASGIGFNLSLLKDGKWSFPENVLALLESEDYSTTPSLPRMIKSVGRIAEFGRIDYEIATSAKLTARAPPGKISEALERRNIDADSKKVASTIKKLYNRSMMLPYTVFRIGLTSSLCFEIICNDLWKKKVLGIINELPNTTFLVSPRGIVLWTLIPGNNQVEYYKMFRSLENQKGVESVHSIMTINQKGSKSILNITQNLPFSKNGFSVPAAHLDLRQYILDI